MDWIERLNKAMNYIEEHLTDEIDYGQLGRIACCSAYHFQRMFTYMAGIERKEYGFVKALGKEMKETFPGFMENKYYQERVHEEERKLIAMHMRSTWYFILYYRVLWGYRKLRKKLKG